MSHSKRGPGLMRCVCRWQVPTSKWWDGVHRLSSRIVLCGALHCSDGMQSRRIHSDDSSECMHAMYSGRVPISEQRDGMH